MKFTKSHENQKVLQIITELHRKQVKSVSFIITEAVGQFSVILQSRIFKISHIKIRFLRNTVVKS